MSTANELEVTDADVIATTGVRRDSGQVLTFLLGDESYGIDILRVREIRGWQPVTMLPESPAHVLGVLNLRGAIVPVIDLRRKMTMQGIEHTATTVIIVVSTETAHGRNDVGLVVDAVSDVTNIDDATVQPMPSVGAESRADYISGISTVADTLVMLLDIDRFIGGDAQALAVPAAIAA